MHTDAFKCETIHVHSPPSNNNKKCVCVLARERALHFVCVCVYVNGREIRSKRHDTVHAWCGNILNEMRCQGLAVCCFLALIATTWNKRAVQFDLLLCNDQTIESFQFNWKWIRITSKRQKESTCCFIKRNNREKKIVQRKKKTLF